jgi:hypothetical protein
MMSQLPAPTESQEQITLFEWVALQTRRHPELELLYHIPNGGHRHKTTAMRLKAEGVKAGVPDLCLPVPRGGYHGLYIEMKASKGRLTENQSMWLGVLAENGYRAALCHGWVEASIVIKNYLKGVHGNE